MKWTRGKIVIVVLPTILIPALIALIWYLKAYAFSETTARSAMKTTVPEAKLKDDGWDKYKLYEQARRDSARLAEEKRMDPYHHLKTITELQEKDSLNILMLERSLEQPEQQIRHINNKVAEIERSGHTHSKPNTDSKQIITRPVPGKHDESVDRLEQMMLMMQEGSQSDPEMQQVESMLDKILEVQNPGLRKQANTASATIQLESVIPRDAREVPVSSFGVIEDSASASLFFNLEPGIDVEGRLIRVLVTESHDVGDGSVIKLVLAEDIQIGRRDIPAGTIVFGKCILQGNRLLIQIESILQKNQLSAVSLSALGPDGQEGLHLPGNVKQELVQEGSNRAIQNIQILAPDQSLATRAATAGVATAKSFLGRRNRIQKVRLMRGYEILFMNTNKLNH